MLSEASRRHNISMYNGGETVCGLDASKKADRQKKQRISQSPVSRAARLYLLPKIHKPGNPGRPIVASNGSATENILRSADFFLRPSIIQLPSYNWDTTNFTNKLRGLLQLRPGCLLLTLDVSSLYMNIPHKEGITACEEFLNHRERQQESPTADLCKLIWLVLTNNPFVFNKTNYLRIHGTATGTRMAPS